ncbi:hypothetical protein [Cellvibrio sp. UBA7661]|uniref:hypothetical protein n=1 Tax=Cellvibrio sp. UBA7661 TaxID=1946311 RepID=UPI002F35996E
MKIVWRTSATIIKWLLLLLVAYQLWIFAHVLLWKWVNPAETSFMDIRLEELREKNPNAKLKHQWVDYPKNLHSFKACGGCCGG